MISGSNKGWPGLSPVSACICVHMQFLFHLQAKDCARTYQGGWWYKNCAHSNLNGRNFAHPNSTWKQGIFWKDIGNYSTYSLEATEMLIRRKKQ